MHVQFIAQKASGEDGAGQVPEALQVNTDRQDLRDPREYWDLLALKALRDLRVIQANLFHPLQLWLFQCPWW